MNLPFKNIIEKNFRKLEKEKVKVEKQIKTIDKSTRYQEDNSRLQEVELESQVDDLEIKEGNNSLKKTLQEYLGQIKQALNRINKKKYGICENCGKPISAARLEVDPSAVYCLECAEKFEKHEE